MCKIEVFAPEAYRQHETPFRTELVKRFQEYVPGGYGVELKFANQQIRVVENKFFEVLELIHFEAALRQTLRWARSALRQEEIAP